MLIFFENPLISSSIHIYPPIENVKGKTHEFKKKFGVNKNISSLCFLIVCGFTQVLVIIESVIVKKKGGICELMMISMDSRTISAF
jgi:hypothetical protein